MDSLIVLGCKCEIVSSVVDKVVQDVGSLVEWTECAKVVVDAVQVSEPAVCTDGGHVVVTVQGGLNALGGQKQ